MNIAGKILEKEVIEAMISKTLLSSSHLPGGPAELPEKAVPEG